MCWYMCLYGKSDLKRVGPSTGTARTKQCKLWGTAELKMLYRAQPDTAPVWVVEDHFLSLRLHLNPFQIYISLHCTVSWSEWGQGPLSTREALLICVKGWETPTLSAYTVWKTGRLPWWRFVLQQIGKFCISHISVSVFFLVLSWQSTWYLWEKNTF